MWSSTASTSSTISIDNKYQRPDAADILNCCCKDRKLYIPDKKFDYKFCNNVFQNSLKETKSLKQDKATIWSKDTGKDKLLNNWANENFGKDQRTLEEIYNDEVVNKKQRDIVKERLYNMKYPTRLQNHNDVPYIERSFCFPKIMCHLGFKSTIHTNEIIRCIQHGVPLFLIDLRFGSPTHHPKMVKRFEKIRLNLNDTSKKIYGLACIINGRTLRVGQMYQRQSVFLDRDSTIILTADRRFSDRGTHNVIYVNFSNYVNKFEPNDEIQIGDNIIVVVKGKTINSIVCIVKNGGLLKKRMLIKIPFNRNIYPPPLITHEEEEDIALAISMGCDYLISTCVTKNLKSHIDWALAVNNRLIIILQQISFSNTPIVKTVEEIDNMYKLSDGVYVYGDCPPESHFLQTYTMQTGIRKQKVIIQAGYLMKHYDKKPNKEELKFFFLYPGCIVFSPLVYDVTNIRTTIRNIYPEINRDNFILSLSPLCQQNNSVESEFCRQMILLSICERISCIIVINNSGHFVRLLAENRPMVPIIANFLDSPYARNCLHSRNVYVTVYQSTKPPTWADEVTYRLQNCIEYGKILDCIHKDVPFLFCYNSRAGLKFCNSIRILLTA